MALDLHVVHNVLIDCSAFEVQRLFDAVIGIVFDSQFDVACLAFLAHLQGRARIAELDTGLFTLHRRLVPVEARLASQTGLLNQGWVFLILNTLINGLFLTNALHHHVSSVALFAHNRSVQHNAVGARRGGVTFSISRGNEVVVADHTDDASCAGRAEVLTVAL